MKIKQRFPAAISCSKCKNSAPPSNSKWDLVKTTFYKNSLTHITLFNRNTCKSQLSKFSKWSLLFSKKSNGKPAHMTMWCKASSCSFLFFTIFDNRYLCASKQGFFSLVMMSRCRSPWQENGTIIANPNPLNVSSGCECKHVCSLLFRQLNVTSALQPDCNQTVGIITPRVFTTAVCQLAAPRC